MLISKSKMMCFNNTQIYNFMKQELEEHNRREIEELQNENKELKDKVETLEYQKKRKEV